MKRTLGCCYYPEHWPQEIWAEDAARMVAVGLTWVRIGEFAWSKIEPEYGRFDWAWLDAAIAVLNDAGLQVVLGTPTATPPRWMLDRHPDMLAVRADGKPRKFGSRRHYCFSHEGYARECDRIVEALAKRYGKQVAAWQTDNEYGCHDTTISYSDAARKAFQDWCAQRYQSPSALNAAWGNVFWSMEYAEFDQIDLPNLTVTEPNPAHVLAFRRFSSDQVVAFNRRQVEIIRAHSNAPVSHNYMGRITDFDHFDVGADLDIATWDSYPLGFLEDRVGADAARQAAYMRQGDPDFQAFHHDLYRAVGDGRWWVMEQQPGPVNWAPFNPAPLPGMVRLWTWEAFAHGAEAVCYFRWRQAPFAQEQMHAGLLRPDSVDAPAMGEAVKVAAELADAPEVQSSVAPVALVFDYDAEFAWEIQPQGQGLSYFGLVFDLYRALRKLGVSVDIVPPNTQDFAGRKLVIASGLMTMSDCLKAALVASNAEVLLGPRTGARTAEMEIPVPLPPAVGGLDVTVSLVETLRPDRPMDLADGGAFLGYREDVEGAADVVETLSDGRAAVMRSGNLTYLAGWPDEVAAGRILGGLCERAGVATIELPEGLRVRDAGVERFWFNYSADVVEFDGRVFEPAGVLREDLYQWIYQLTFFLGFQSLRISESPHSSIEKERVMGAAVKIERKDMSARELRRLAGGVKDGRVSRRLLAIALVLEGVSRKVAAESCGMDRQILCDWVHRYNAEGVDGLSDRLGGGVKPLLTADQMEQLAAWVEAGPDLERDGVVRWRRADLARRIEAEFGIKLHERTVGTYLAKLGFRRMSVRPHHPKADPQAQTAFKKNFERLVAEGLPERAKGKPLEIWFQDEARVGQQGTLTRIWAKRGTRPRAPRDTRYKWSYIFGAACPERGAAAGLILPYVNTEAMELHLAEIAKTVAGNAHALLIVDGAGWHGAKNLKLPDNITLLKLPPYSPELNPMENVWQYLRANKLAITVFDTYEDILDKCSDAWNFFAGDQERITSITYREWATVK